MLLQSYIAINDQMRPLYSLSAEYKGLWGFVGLAPYLSLLDDNGLPIRSLRQLRSKKSLGNIRRQFEQAQRQFGDCSFKDVSKDENLKLILVDIQRLFMKRWRDQYTSSPLSSADKFETILQTLLNEAQKNKVKVYTLNISNNEIVAFAICFVDGRILRVWQHCAALQPEYRKYSFGKILYFKLVEQSLGSFTCIDFMLGAQSYKYEWTDRQNFVYLSDKMFLPHVKIFLIVKLIIGKSDSIKFFLKKVLKKIHG